MAAAHAVCGRSGWPTTKSGTIRGKIDPKDITFLEIFPEWEVTYPVW